LLNKEEVRQKIREVGIVPAIRVHSAEHALFAAEGVSQGGIPIAEIAMTMPDATDVISQLVKKHPTMVVGAGSVLNAELARTCLDAGAKFLTSDGLHLEVIEFARKNDVVIFPGALTPTEVITAWKSGCDFVKVVPCAHMGGESYIRSLASMFPEIPLIAAGGISQETASDYIVAGALALGVGSELILPDALRRQQMDRIAELARRFAGFVKTGRHDLHARRHRLQAPSA
jgi:2-dehydro-3-deoxyphosphogluconate aldolase / (4S)-4-hydroxy-2-oxoglutarate aldolase